MILYLFKNFILNKIYLLIENKYYFINKISKMDKFLFIYFRIYFDYNF